MKMYTNIFKTKEGSKGTEGKKDIYRKQIVKQYMEIQPFQYYFSVNRVTVPTKSIDSLTG